MIFTFECGVCQAVYRLDEKQIAPSGSKITCPRCLNFFLLKKADASVVQSPIIETLVQDGAREVPDGKEAPKPTPTAYFHKPSDPQTETFSNSEKTLRFDSREPSIPKVRDDVRPFPSLKAAPKVARDPSPLLEPDQGVIELTKKTQNTRFEEYLMLLALIVIVGSVLFLLNLKGIVNVPGLERFRAIPTVEVQPPPVPSEPKNLRHGFPQVDAGYDPWASAPSNLEE